MTGAPPPPAIGGESWLPWIAASLTLLAMTMERTGWAVA